jgi:hypothetical protein
LSAPIRDEPIMLVSTLSSSFEVHDIKSARVDLLNAYPS